MCLPIKVNRPDAVLEEGEHLGFEWTITHNGSGYRCGYVRVQKGHPWHGVDYDNIACEVHGGLTFASPDEECGKGEPEDAWWVGFDCAHLGDAQDPELPASYVMDRYWNDSVKSQDYVRRQCMQLCEQAKAAI